MNRSGEKRTVSVSVKMTAEDQHKIQAAAKLIWPGAIVTKSSAILGMALLCAEDALKKKKGDEGEPHRQKSS